MQSIVPIDPYNWKRIIKRGIFLLTIPCISTMYDKLNHFTGKEVVVKTFIDDFIPMVEIFVVPYIIWFGYVGTFLGILCVFDEDKYFRLLISLNVGMLVCYITYYIYPSFIQRPYIYGKDIWSQLIRWIYRTDKPYNCFPSIHVLNSVLVGLFVNKSRFINYHVKCISSVIAILIILSTMFIKQHYLIDVIAGIMLAYFIYFISNLFKNKKHHIYVKKINYIKLNF